jgi:putative nucleotidyltransferase with HDIG domain
MEKPTREDAWKLLTEFTNSESLIAHALAVEGVMRYLARKAGEDEEVWGVIGLIHDMDYEKYPDQHCIKVRELMSERGWPEEYIRAVQSHGWGICTDVKPESRLEKNRYRPGMPLQERYGHESQIGKEKVEDHGLFRRGGPLHHRKGSGNAFSGA